MDYYYNIPVTRLPGASPTPMKRACPDLNTVLINSLNPLAAVPTAPILRQQHTLVPLPGAISQYNPVLTTSARKVIASRHKTLSTSSYKSTSSPSLHSSAAPQPLNGTSSSPTEVQGDILICGSCRQLFKSLSELTEHKRFKCRVPCNCASRKAISKEPSVFTCATCHIDFECCWTLCQHCQSEHGLQIFVDNKNQEKCVVKSNESDLGLTKATTDSHIEMPQIISNYDKLDTSTLVNGI